MSDGSDLLVQLGERIEEVTRKEANTDNLINMLDRWVRAIGDQYGNTIEWELLDDVWRETHDLLSKVRGEK